MSRVLKLQFVKVKKNSDTVLMNWRIVPAISVDASVDASMVIDLLKFCLRLDAFIHKTTIQNIVSNFNYTCYFILLKAIMK